MGALLGWREGNADRARRQAKPIAGRGQNLQGGLHDPSTEELALATPGPHLDQRDSVAAAVIGRMSLRILPAGYISESGLVQRCLINYPVAKLQEDRMAGLAPAALSNGH